MFLGYFCQPICCQELSKIAQSGHTGREREVGAYQKSFRTVRKMLFHFASLAALLKRSDAAASLDCFIVTDKKLFYCQTLAVARD